MARPTVLVATTNPAMAYALQESLKEKCRSLGLKLEVCPDGDESKVGDANVRIYDSAEAMFDALEKRDPMVLVDTLVVLDVGAELENAFSCAVSSTPEQGGWHVTSQQRAGVAVELLLRFPQVFPVFLSPAVPIIGSNYPTFPSCFKYKLQTGHHVDKCETGCWKGFSTLQEKFAVKHKWKDVGSEEIKSESLDIQHLFALAVPLHFVSPLDQGKGLKTTLDRFAHGMRCWFDPTGLRILVKNHFLGRVFGNDENWNNTKCKNDKTQLRDALLSRLVNETIAVDEEREFALLNAYASWKYGRRSWMVTTYGEFYKGLWVTRKGEKARDVIVLRDVDIRFPDIFNEPQVNQDGQPRVREQLKDVGSIEWKRRIDDTWFVRAISGDADVIENADAVNRVGQYPENIQSKNGTKYYGFRKPIGSLYELKSVLGKDAKDAGHSSLSIIGVAKDGEGSGGHGAPYSNLAMAEALLRSSSACKDSPSAHLIGALLAMEAYELLMGMSKTTALEALLAVHKHEVMAEVSFPGVSHSVDTENRKKDIEATLISLFYGSNREANDDKKIKRMFLSQFWAELRICYREGEQFDAAEDANTESLLNSSWKPQHPGEFKALAIWLEADFCSACLDRCKYLIILPATSLIWWAIYALAASLFFSVLYGFSCKFFPSWNGFCYFINIWWQVIMAMLQMQLGSSGIVKMEGELTWLSLVEVFHMGVSYVLLGLLISMLYRKITRS